MNRTLKLFERFFVSGLAFAFILASFSLLSSTIPTHQAYAESTPIVSTTVSPVVTYAPRTLKLTIPRIKGDDVKALQTFLNNSGYNCGIADGIFGPKTEAQVELFQIANNLIPDGKAGKNTMAAISQSPVSNYNYTNTQTRTSGCNSSLGFSTTTGQSCTTIFLPTGCNSTSFFSITTGLSCGIISLPTGCTSSLGFSTTLGVSCSTGLSATQTFLSVVSGWHSGPSIHTVSPTISGVTIPAQGGTPISTLTDTTQYSATISWTGSPSIFLASTSYTATITITPKTNYTLTGVTANFFTVAGATATNDINSGVITAVFPATGTTIITATIAGVTAPVTGATPTATITATTEYTATISWSPTGTFSGGQVYTATITLTPNTGYTLTGVTANFFTVAGATATNPINSGVVSAVFPATAQLPATTPSSIVLAVGSTAPVGGVTNVAIPAAGVTDTTGVITGWVATSADKIKFTVTNGGAATSTITINGGAYTSGADYQIVPTTSLPIIIVTTTETGKVTGVRTFVITGPILGADGLTYGIVLGADGKMWLDRNLGATQVATSATDYQAYGSLYQWGRGADGHQLITHTTATAATPVNGNTATLSATDIPGDNLFIKSPTTPNDWRNPQNNNLWQGVNGTNNVCPAGFRLPTNTEQQTLITAAGITNMATAYSSSLKLTATGYRDSSSASLGLVGASGQYWSSSVSGTSALNSVFEGSVSPARVGYRAYGLAVRCLAVFPATQLLATAPSSIVLAVGSTAPVGGVTNVAIPVAGGTDTTGVITGYVATSADKIKFTVTNGGAATSTITINGVAYTSGADYQIVPTTSLPTIVVTTTEAGKITTVRTFVITGPILGADGLTYGIVLGADGKMWLDRNLGATQVATSATDYLAYGSLFQWGRGADGHQLITHTSATAATAVNGSTTILSVTDTPGDNLYIIKPASPYDWRSTQNDNLWQGVNGVNNVCPAGFRLPTNTEQQALITAAGITNSATAYNSSLKLTVAGNRGNSGSDASIYPPGAYGFYWSSSVSGTSASDFSIGPSTVTPSDVDYRTRGCTVRCLKN